MEKTIKQLSEEYGITKQAMRKRINQLPPTTVSTGANRTILINEDGQEILRKKLAVKELNKVTIEVSTKQLTSDNQLILELKHKIDLLEQENQFQNEKIMSLQKQLDEKKEDYSLLCENLKNAQYQWRLEHEERLALEAKQKEINPVEQVQPEEPVQQDLEVIAQPEPEKKSWWQRIFGL